MSAQQKGAAGTAEPASKPGTQAPPPTTPPITPAPQTPPPTTTAASTRPTNAELQKNLLEATIAVSVLVVVAACVVCGVLVWRINRHQVGLTQQQLQNELAALPTRQRVEELIAALPTRQYVQDSLAPLATLAQVQAAITPVATQAQVQALVAPLATQQQLLANVAGLATQQQLQAAVTPLATAAGQQASDRSLQALHDDLARLNQDVALMKGSNDSVLSMISHLVPGAPPRIITLEPATARIGTAIVLWGANFQANSRVWFGTTPAQPSEATENMLRVTVPDGVSGDVNLHVQGLSGISAPYRFTIAPPPKA